MTETTEENIKPRAGALGSTIEENMLPKIKSKLKKQAALITNLEAQVSSLTKKRDELKDENHDLGDEICRLEDVNGDLKVQVYCLDVENKEFKSQLSNRDKEIENGKPIEEAPTDGTPVLAWKTGSGFQPYTQHCEEGIWGRLTSAMGFEPSREQPDRFIYLPVTSPGGLASWRPDLNKSNKEGESE